MKLSSTIAAAAAFLLGSANAVDFDFFDFEGWYKGGYLSDQRATFMEMLFNGGNCDQSFNIQEADKFDCTDQNGGPGLTGQYYIHVVPRKKPDGDVYFSGPVNVGDVFPMCPGYPACSSDRFDADSTVWVYPISAASNPNFDPVNDDNWHQLVNARFTERFLLKAGADPTDDALGLYMLLKCEEGEGFNGNNCNMVLRGPSGFFLCGEPGVNSTSTGVTFSGDIGDYQFDADTGVAKFNILSVFCDGVEKTEVAPMVPLGPTPATLAMMPGASNKHVKSLKLTLLNPAGTQDVSTYYKLAGGFKSS